MTPCTTFVDGINCWKANPTHRPRGWAIEPIIILEPEPIVVKPARNPPHTSRRGVVLEQIQRLGLASCNDLIDTMNLRKHVIDCALKGLRKEGKVLVKCVPIVNRKPSHLYYSA